MKAINVHSYKSFVAPAVKENALTSRIIETIMPYFPADCRCIAAYLDARDQYWKVNYHWDYLNWKINTFMNLDEVSGELKKCAQGVQNALHSNEPTPAGGYRNDKEVGHTKDISSPDKIIARHAILRQSKRDFERILIKAGLVRESTRRDPPGKEKTWWLAVAPVALPGNSRHGTGYALDIAGNNKDTTRICRALQATLIFNESSHVHVEFANLRSIAGVPQFA